MDLVLIRHGLPEKIVNDDGMPADPPLSEQGRDQARRLTQWLADEPFDRLYSSPMRRAFQTAEALASARGLDIELCDGVAEYDQHAEHYIPVEELKELDYERWQRVMRGETDEIDFPRFIEAVTTSIEEIIARNAGRRVAIACHGGVINVWTAHVIGFEPRLFFNPDYTSIHRYRAACSGERSVITLNEHFHLLG